MKSNLKKFSDKVRKEYREEEHGPVVRKYKISSASDSKLLYHINKYKDGIWDCDCVAYSMGKGEDCKHITAIRSMVEKLKLNEKEVRFKGRFPVGVNLDWSKDIKFEVKGQLTEMTHHDNDDGSYDRRYVIGINSVKVIK